MKIRLSLSALFIISGFISGCHHLAYRSPESGYGSQRALERQIHYQTAEQTSQHRYDPLIEKAAYELGFNPSQGLSGGEYSQVQDRVKLRDLERRLGSHKEREQYSRVLPWLTTDREKIDLLSIPSLEGRQAWINRKQIWNRAKEPDATTKSLIESQDIALGMPQNYVKKSWGEPQAVEVSGNPVYKNERWKYVRQVASPEGFRRETRYVYFEGGKVVGWETN